MSAVLDVLQIALGICVVGPWTLRVLRRDERARDEHGRLRPGYAVVVAVGGCVAVGLLLAGIAGLVGV